MSKDISIFVSSKMQELLEERQALQAFLPTLSNDIVNVHPWVFEEDATASDKSIREIYLNALKESALYLGLFWNDYGEWTIDEFDQASEWSIDRHIYVKNVDAAKRDPRLQAFLDEQSDVISGITPKWFDSTDNLLDQVQRSITVWLQDRLQRRPGDISASLVEFSDDIPELPKRLIGRDDVAQEVRDLLDEGGQILLQGFGGSGKSAIAATVAADWIDDDEGDVLWLRAGNETADALLEAMARPLGVQQEIANQEDKKKAKTIRQAISSADISLLVLDDVWDGAALSVVLKAVPRRMSVLVTARHRYPLETIIEVGGLDAAEALKLFGYYAGQKYQDGSDASEVCRQLGYHAFALEVAGKTLKVDQIEPSDLLERIAEAPHAMEMPSDFAEEGRSSITELLSASLYTLDEDVRRVFLAFGLMFIPSATPDLLARYLEVDEAEIQSALTILQRRGLAERMHRAKEEVTYFRVHDLAFSYARSLASVERQSAIVQAVRAYTDDHAANLGALDAELGNILGAADVARDSGAADQLLDIMGVLIGPYLSARGHTLRFAALLDDAIIAAEQLGDDYHEIRHFLLSKRGNIYYDRGDLPHAAQSYLDALALARLLHKHDRETILLCAAGKVRADQKADDDAVAYFGQAYDIARSLDDGFLLAFVLEHQGYYAQSQERYEDAKRYFAEEVALADEIQDPETTFFALLNLGSVEYVLEQFDIALTHHEAALSIGQEVDNRIWEAYAQQSLGEDYHKLDDTGRARACFAEALALFRSSGMQAKVAEVETYMEDAGYTIQ